MANFKIGQRVRIMYPAAQCCGREGTVTSDLQFGELDTSMGRITASYHTVAIDGLGESQVYMNGFLLLEGIFAFEPKWLVPLDKPGEASEDWKKIKGLMSDLDQEITEPVAEQPKEEELEPA